MVGSIILRNLLSGMNHIPMTITASFNKQHQQATAAKATTKATLVAIQSTGV